MYIYYWIPNKTLFSCDLKVQSKTLDISDNVEKEKNLLKIQFLENKNIEILYKNNKYILEYIQHTKKGMFVYTCDNQMNKELLKIQVYHLFKDICHIHNSHNEEEDSLLIAYISDKLDINKSIEYYSQTYIEKFKQYENIINEFISQQSNEFEIITIQNQKKLLIKAKEELLYAYFLSKDTKYYELFINIENNFNILIEKLNLKESEKLFKVNNIINRWQFILAIIGLGLGIGGIYYALKGANATLQSNMNKNIKSISNKLNKTHIEIIDVKKYLIEDKYISNKNSKTINNILHKINQCKVLKESKK